MEKKDEQLVSDYLGGNENAFSIIVRRYLKSIYNFIYRLIGNVAEAEDITQNVFLSAWKNIKSFKREESFKTWIFSIARNAAIDWLRKKKNITFSDLEKENEEGLIEDTLIDPAPLPEELLTSFEDKRKLEEAINQLPLLYREVIFLYYNNDFTFEEIGKILNKPLNTVKSQYRRALFMLKNILMHQK